MRLHDNAEKAGIRAGVVELKMPNETDVYSMDVFDTVDKGRIMVDPMGTPILCLARGPSCTWTIMTFTP